MKKVFFYTLGCRLNQCETEAVAEAFEKEGFETCTQWEKGELCIVNTCLVTGKAQQKARRVIRLFSRNPDTKAVLVTGCYAQLYKESLEALDPKVVAVRGFQKSSLLNLPSFINANPDLDVLEACRKFASSLQEARLMQNPFAFNTHNFSFHSRAYLKVQDGCDNNCFYCLVRQARGPAVSLSLETALQRALALEKAGYREIVLTGLNLTMYDRKGGKLSGLLEAFLKALGSEIRIRFSSLEPDGLDEKFFDLIQDPRVQPYFHIPIQSASDVVLKRANRHYTSSDLVMITSRIRKAKPFSSLGCDVIAGLPGEGEKEFEETFSFLKETHFAKLHVFPFSPRPGTPFYTAKDRVPEAIRDQRTLKLRKLSETLRKDYILSQAGKQTEALLENFDGNWWEGLSGNGLKIKMKDCPLCKKGALLKAKFPQPMPSSEPIAVTLDFQ